MDAPQADFKVVLVVLKFDCVPEEGVEICSISTWCPDV